MVEQVRRKKKLAFASHEAFEPDDVELIWDLPRKVGGRIWIESEGEGQGSTFFFTLPSNSS